MKEQKNGMPRHRILAQEIRKRISDGEFSVGDVLPTERKISEDEGLSRATVREALRILEMQGMLRRRQGSGTVVVAADPQIFMLNFDSLEMFFNAPSRTFIKVESIIPVPSDDKIKESLSLSKDCSWSRISYYRYMDNSETPISHTYIYVLEEYSDILNLIDGLGVTIFREIEKRFEVTTADATLRIDAAPVQSEIAEQLHVAPGSASVIITRSYRDQDGRFFQFAVTTHPGGRYAFEAKLRL